MKISYQTGKRKDMIRKTHKEAINWAHVESSTGGHTAAKASTETASTLLGYDAVK